MSSRTPWPWSKIPDSTPADWGFGMTICIAAVAHEGQSLIMASDRMISTDYFSGDGLAFKAGTIHPDWKILIAGNDLSRTEAVIHRIKTELSEEPCGVSVVEEAITAAWRAELQKRAENRYLSRYGMSMADFVANGPSVFAQQYSEMKYQIDNVGLGFQLLIAGFDSSNVPHIMSVADPGEIENHDMYGFWAIGSGSHMALSSLFLHSYSPEQSSLEKATFMVTAAKFLAESAPGVGKQTILTVMHRDGDVRTTATLDELRLSWENGGKPIIPYGAEQAAEAVLKRSQKYTRRRPQSAAQRSSGQQ